MSALVRVRNLRFRLPRASGVARADLGESDSSDKELVDTDETFRLRSIRLEPNRLKLIRLKLVRQIEPPLQKLHSRGTPAQTV